MSKKLIAVASAAALALTGLVVVPTVATAAPGPFTVTATGAATNHVARDGSTAAKSLQINVPSADVLRSNTDSTEANGATSSSTAIKFAVQTPGAAGNDAITVTATGGVKVLTSAQLTATSPAPTTATGVQSLTTNSINGDADIYAYTTTVDGGTVVISSGGSSKTYHISGISTWAYKMNFTAGAAAGIGGKFTLTGTVKDAFGNDLTSPLLAADFHITVLGGSASLAKGAVAATTATTYAYNATTKVYTITGTVRDTAGSQAVSLVVETAGKKGAKVTAFGDPILDQFFTVNGLDLATQVTSLTAQVAALTAQLAESRPKATSVTKKRYNTLARKWNAAFPSQRVALKK